MALNSLAKTFLCASVVRIQVLAQTTPIAGECRVYEHFSKVNDSCCLLNLDCVNICCVEGLCIPDSPCPYYDDSIELWEEEQFNAMLDQQVEANQNDADA